ncbi:MAG: peptidase M15 [Synergistaceae bacterium]|jgi:hypothetical protein|nr:peptidase M15 [Synergistaceae bacterium]
MTKAPDLNDFPVSPHFNLREFECRCCGCVKLSGKLILMLEEFRSALGRPVVITSGYRCPRHNAAVGGARRSLHLTGRAADMSYRPQNDSSEAIEGEMLALAQISSRIGFYEFLPNLSKNYIHFSCK